MGLLYSLKARPRVLLVLFLVAYLATGLATLGFQTACAVLVPICFLLTLTVYRSPKEPEDDPQRPFPFLASLAARAPPVS